MKAYILGGSVFVMAMVAGVFATNVGTGPAKHVELGGVAWFNDEATAFEQSKKLGRPVLTLQMMGRLDDDFC